MKKTIKLAFLGLAVGSSIFVGCSKEESTNDKGSTTGNLAFAKVGATNSYNYVGADTTMNDFISTKVISYSNNITAVSSVSPFGNDTSYSYVSSTEYLNLKEKTLAGGFDTKILSSSKAGDSYASGSDSTYILAIGQTVSVPAGSFSNCFKAKTRSGTDAPGSYSIVYFSFSAGYIKSESYSDNKLDATFVMSKKNY